MLERLLSTIAPHHCYGCGILGSILCEYCKNYLLDEPFLRCIVCDGPTDEGALCLCHDVPYLRGWCVARREGAISKVIDAYKFERVMAAHETLAALLDAVVPQLPEQTVIVPIPTTPKNVRIRGYDHMLLVARSFASKRKLRCSPLLRRRNNITQHFTKSAQERKEQAKSFFGVAPGVSSDVPYLILDDIMTTGATLESAARTLCDAGATEVWVGVLTRQ